MRLLKEMYFSSETYKMALYINAYARSLSCSIESGIQSFIFYVLLNNCRCKNDDKNNQFAASKSQSM